MENKEIRKPSFLVYYDNEVVVLRLSDDEAGKLFKSLFPYGKKEIRPDFDNSPALAMAFDILSMAIDRDKQKYVKKCEKNRENGKKGGRPKKNQTDIEETERFNSKPKKADRDKDKGMEKEKDTGNIPFTSLTLKEGETLPPPADAGGASPFTFMDCQECAEQGKVNISADGIAAFFERMEKDGWKIKGTPVTNLLLAMRGFAKNHKQYQAQAVQEKPDHEDDVTSKKKNFKHFKLWLKYHGYDRNYEGHGDFEEEITLSENVIEEVFKVDNSAESMYNINERLLESGFNKEDIRPLMKLFNMWRRGEDYDVKGHRTV